MENNKDKVIDMYIKQYDNNESIDYRLVVKTESGKTFYIKAKDESPEDFDDFYNG